MGYSPRGHTEPDTTEPPPLSYWRCPFAAHMPRASSGQLMLTGSTLFYDVFNARALVCIYLFAVGCSRWFPFLDVLTMPQ